MNTLIVEYFAYTARCDMGTADYKDKAEERQGFNVNKVYNYSYNSNKPETPHW